MNKRKYNKQQYIVYYEEYWYGKLHARGGYKFASLDNLQQWIIQQTHTNNYAKHITINPNNPSIKIYTGTRGLYIHVYRINLLLENENDWKIKVIFCNGVSFRRFITKEVKQWLESFQNDLTMIKQTQ